ncbi:DUF4190 domain-containing protein [Streptomyces sp. NBC_01304]|uniref:DUF4190 domain-containing protein n=1 Tax=Streptomyces sp. NBC_01304 TaxID=2903818 RepID=UPI002E0D7CB0|nr:DUF4190 domain-containing protein [Streptomyces sp. NBC_01304]
MSVPPPQHPSSPQHASSQQPFADGELPVPADAGRSPAEARPPAEARSPAEHAAPPQFPPGTPAWPQPPANWQAPPAAWPPPAAGMPQQRPPMNGLAIAAFVLSLICVAPLALILGIVALVQISRRGERGKGLAVAGVTVSGASLLLSLVLLLTGTFALSTFGTPERDKGSGRVTEPTRTSIYEIKTGDCFNPGEELTAEN